VKPAGASRNQQAEKVKIFLESFYRNFFSKTKGNVERLEIKECRHIPCSRASSLPHTLNFMH